MTGRVEKEGGAEQCARRRSAVHWVRCVVPIRSGSGGGRCRRVYGKDLQSLFISTPASKVGNNYNGTAAEARRAGGRARQRLARAF